MDPNLKNFIASQSDIVTIEYHTKFPALNDFFYDQNPMENNRRRLYYSIISVPQNRFDGSTDGTNTIGNWQGVYDARKAIPSRARIEVEATLDTAQGATTGSLAVTVIAEDTLTGGDWVVRATITESDIAYAAPNGINTHHHVMRKMLPDADGTSVTFSGTLPDTALISLPFALDSTWVTDNLTFVAFLQDDATTEVEQSAAVTLPSNDVSTPLGGAPPAPFAIESIRPNPFNPQTTISLRTTGDRAFDLSVYDVSGRLVRILLRNGAGESGAAVWDGRGDDGAEAASGRYWFVLSGDGERAVRSGVLLR